MLSSYQRLAPCCKQDALQDLYDIVIRKGGDDDGIVAPQGMALGTKLAIVGGVLAAAAVTVFLVRGWWRKREHAKTLGINRHAFEPLANDEQSVY